MVAVMVAAMVVIATAKVSAEHRATIPVVGTSEARATHVAALVVLS